MLLLTVLVLIFSGAHGKFYSENTDFNYVNVNGNADYKLNHMVNDNGRILAKKEGPFKPQLENYFQKRIPISRIEYLNNFPPVIPNLLHQLYPYQNRIPIQQNIIGYVQKQFKDLIPSEELYDYASPVLQLVYPKTKKSFKHHSYSSEDFKKLELLIGEDFDDYSDEDFDSYSSSSEDSKELEMPIHEDFADDFKDDFDDFYSKFNVKLPYSVEIVNDENKNDKNKLYQHKKKTNKHHSQNKYDLDSEPEDSPSEPEDAPSLPSEEAELVESKQKHAKKNKKHKKYESEEYFPDVV